MDERPHFPGATSKDAREPWTEYTEHVRKWEDLRSKLYGRVKSMSGWTRRYFGEPTEKWLAEAALCPDR